MQEERAAQERARLDAEAKEAAQKKILIENQPPTPVEVEEKNPAVGEYIIVVSAHICAAKP